MNRRGAFLFIRTYLYGFSAGSASGTMGAAEATLAVNFGTNPIEFFSGAVVACIVLEKI